MEKLASLYHHHLATLQTRAQAVLARHQLDALLIHSGELLTVFLDDHDYPFKVNPQFKAWVPVTQVPNCWLWVDGVNPPKLWFYSPVDYWHNVAPVPESFWTEEIEITVLRNADDIGQLLPSPRERVAYIGYAPQRAQDLGIRADNINPQGCWTTCTIIALTKPITSWPACVKRRRPRLSVIVPRMKHFCPG